MSNPCVSPDSSSLMICESLGVFALSNPSVSRYSSSLMIYESVGAVCAVESVRHLGQEFVDDL